MHKFTHTYESNYDALCRFVSAQTLLFLTVVHFIKSSRYQYLAFRTIVASWQCVTEYVFARKL